MTDTPWKTDGWHTSPWNFDPEVTKDWKFPENIRIHDVTLGTESSKPVSPTTMMTKFELQKDSLKSAYTGSKPACQSSHRMTQKLLPSSPSETLAPRCIPSPAAWWMM